MNYNEARLKAEKLVSQMTVEEKASQLLFDSPAIERLGIEEYNWWNEASHGVARAGTATVFPHAIALAASFNPELIFNVADAISTEGRAKYNRSVKYGDRDIFKGLTYWTPNINIFRDPRWGRGQETFGEDPFLTATMGTQFVKGLQGDGEFLKAAGCAKHYAVHSGPESLRHGFDAKANDKDMWETYLPAFQKLVEAGVAGVMGAYNRTNTEPCCASKTLIGDILRKQWSFKGYFVSDCGAVLDISQHHHFVETDTEAAAVALKNGCNLNCGQAYRYLMDAYEEDLITEEDLTQSAIQNYTIRYLLGEFEEKRPYSDIDFDKLDCEEHKQLNLEAAKESMVLLQNTDNFLPVNPEKYKNIAVVGPNASSIIALEGNYNGKASEYVTVADGMRKVFPDSNIRVAQGCNLFAPEKKNDWDGFVYNLSGGLSACEGADLAVLCLGYDRTVEGEDMKIDDDIFMGGDRKKLYLPKVQTDLAEKVCEICENVVIVVMAGSAVDIGESLSKKVKAVIHAWYPGSLGGLAVAELLAGEYSPSGKTPLTFHKGDAEIPEFTDYSMTGRTYRFLNKEEKVVYPYGFGLTYTQFEFSSLEIKEKTDEKIKLSVTVSNKGNVSSKNKVQVYASYSDSRTVTPNFQLCAITPVEVRAGERKTVELCIDRYWVKAVLENGQRVEPDGEITLYVSDRQPDERSNELSTSNVLSIKL
ncbi:MAG: glycoside hydrolase family 3 C-terminal domain-containing protein [Clostridia bacterium]|nr:glycoside hydrolase family 3 C-terminal domain-containing protein [Clostridia bacterium]